MPHYVTNKGLYYIANNAISSSTDLRAAVMKGTTPSAATIRDLDDLAAAIATTWDEAAAANYARIDLASVTITESDASDNVTITAAAPTINSVGAGETWVAICYYIEGASDAARPLISVDVPASSIATNGGNITLPAFSLTITNP